MNIIELREKMKDCGHSSEYVELCCSYAENLQKRSYPVIFDSIHLSSLIGIDPIELFAYVKLADKLYSEIEIPKKSDGIRTLNIPCENLKYIQKWILENILYRVAVISNVTGFVPKKSIVDNAKLHVNKECVINIDIKNFFPSVQFFRVYEVFSIMGFTKHLCMVFTKLCTLNGVLPQGAPTSPYLSNLICERLDCRMMTLAEKIDADYTRYADDITFSGRKKISSYLTLIKRIVSDEGFEVNQKKVRVQYRHHKQMVTGLVVNDKLSVPSKTKRYLRQQIHLAVKYGVDESLIRQGISKSNYKGHLEGLINFIKMVEPAEAIKFRDQFSKIIWN